LFNIILILAGILEYVLLGIDFAVRYALFFLLAQSFSLQAYQQLVLTLPRP
jgi:hypothetical protein